MNLILRNTDRIEMSMAEFIIYRQELSITRVERK